MYIYIFTFICIYLHLYVYIYMYDGPWCSIWLLTISFHFELKVVSKKPVLPYFSNIAKFRHSKTSKRFCISVLAKYIEYFEIQQKQNIQNIQRFMKSLQKRCSKRLLGEVHSSLNILNNLIFWNISELKRKQNIFVLDQNFDYLNILKFKKIFNICLY